VLCLGRRQRHARVSGVRWRDQGDGEGGPAAGLAEASLAGNPCLTWKEFITAIARRRTWNSGARKRFEDMQELGIIRKNHFGQWKPHR